MHPPLLSISSPPHTQVMDELTRVTHDLHAAQDHVARIQPAADIVFDIRRRQQEWDEAKHAVETGAPLPPHLGGPPADGGAGAHQPHHFASPFAKSGAMRKLGPRPSVTL